MNTSNGSSVCFGRDLGCSIHCFSFFCSRSTNLNLHFLFIVCTRQLKPIYLLLKQKKNAISSLCLYSVLTVFWDFYPLSCHSPCRVLTIVLVCISSLAGHAELRWKTFLDTSTLRKLLLLLSQYYWGWHTSASPFSRTKSFIQEAACLSAQSLLVKSSLRHYRLFFWTKLKN